MSFSTATVLIFIVLLLVSVIFYRPKCDGVSTGKARLMFGAFIATMTASLGIYELVFKGMFGRTISQLQNTIAGWDAILFTVTFFGAWVALFLHFNWARIKEWWDKRRS
jgi:nitrogen fixation protein FixH